MTDLVHDSKIIDWTYSANWTENLSSGYFLYVYLYRLSILYYLSNNKDMFC